MKIIGYIGNMRIIGYRKKKSFVSKFISQTLLSAVLIFLVMATVWGWR